MSQQWYVKSGEKALGPFTSGQLRRLAAAGKLTAKHQFSLDQKRWFRAEKVQGLMNPPTPKAADSVPTASLHGVEKTPSESDAVVDCLGCLFSLIFALIGGVVAWNVFPPSPNAAGNFAKSLSGGLVFGIGGTIGGTIGAMVANGIARIVSGGPDPKN
jgi:hypothetical protein